MTSVKLLQKFSEQRENTSTGGCVFSLFAELLQHTLHLIAVACQEVELEAGQDTHNDEYQNGGDVGAGTQAPTGCKWDVRLGLVGEDGQREEGERSDVDEQAGTQHQPHTETAEVIFAHHSELAPRHTR